jgi:hypothetical protein
MPAQHQIPQVTLAPAGDRSTSRLASSTATHGSRVIHGSYRVKVMDDPSLPVRVSRGLRSTYALSYGRDPMGAAALGVLFCYGPKILTASAISPKTTSCFPAPPPRCGPTKLAAVMIVTGCRCDLVWHCGRKAMATAKPTMVKTNGATIAAVKSCSILSTPKRGGCNPV